MNNGIQPQPLDKIIEHYKPIGGLDVAMANIIKDITEKGWCDEGEVLDVLLMAQDEIARGRAALSTTQQELDEAKSEINKTDEIADEILDAVELHSGRQYRFRANQVLLTLCNRIKQLESQLRAGNEHQAQSDNIKVVLDARAFNSELHKIRARYHRTPDHPVYLLACAASAVMNIANEVAEKAVVIYNDLKTVLDEDQS